ncbi:MAG: hypothetical protein F9K47_07280 [Burkholderiales bacterium]|nr:MAG: hypothetical protein F9K47_07280 [Burkholderiales bacterium]
MISRRDFLYRGASFLVLPLAACGHKGTWPEGMAEIKWDRDTCTRCGMVISDPRFAAQLRGGPKNQAMSFDDIGCLVFWQRDQAAKHAWMNEAATRFWVADADALGAKWLDPREAHYLPGRLSPMGYNFAAVAQANAGSVRYEDMRRDVLARGK